MNDSVHHRQEIEREIIERASEDADYREQLLADPRAALSEYVNGAVPEDADVRVFEETPGSYYFVLPAQAAQGNGELTEDMLEAVAGGDWVELLWTSICWGDGPDTSAPDVEI